MKISKSIQAYEEELQRIRRELHRIPELSGQERETSQYVYDFLCALHPDALEVLFETGVRAVFLVPGATRTIAFRADIDGLPVQELNEEAEFVSSHAGCMHACGHDGHTAIMLCLASLVARRREMLRENIVFLFQPAEEADGGALPMIERGALRQPDVDEIYGLHLWPSLPAGKFGLKAGPLMSHMRDLNVDIYGKGAHGARPQNGVDAMVAAAQFINQVQSVVSRNVDPYEMAVVTLGVISGGEARNVICGSVHIEGTIRTFDKAVSDGVKARVLEILQGLEAGMGVRTAYSETMTFPAVVNPPELVGKARALLDVDDVVEVQEVMMSEDFSQYQEHTKGLFLFLGIGEDAEPLHSGHFNFDERYLMNGMEFMARVIGLAV